MTAEDRARYGFFGPTAASTAAATTGRPRPPLRRPPSEAEGVGDRLRPRHQFRTLFVDAHAGGAADP